MAGVDDNPDSDHNPDDALAAPFQRLATAAMAAIALDGWALDVVDVRGLATERDDTALITTADGVRRILKVAHPLDDPGVLDFQVAAMDWAAARDPLLPLPRVEHDRDGRALREVLGTAGEPRLARVLSYLPGEVLDYVGTTSAQRVLIGAVAGRLSLALEGFEHPGSARVLAWDLQQVGSLRGALDHVPAEARDAAIVVLDAYDSRVGPALRATRQQVVHHDLNPDNLLVDASAPEFVTGVLDFGDLVRSSVVGDLAVAMTYALDGGMSDDGDPWLAAYDVARGFIQVRELDEDEVALLPDLVRTRLAQRLMLNSLLAASDPSNAHYTARTVHRAVAALDRLAHTPPPTDALVRS